MYLDKKPATQALITAIVLGVIYGAAAALHWVRYTPLNIGMIAFVCNLYGHRIPPRRR